MLLAGILVFLLFYLLVDPARSRWVPQCAFRNLTGLECPGCGSQRAFHALLTGHVADAWNYNPFLILMVPVILLMLFADMFRYRFPALHRTVNSLPVILSVLAAVVGWFLYRNFIL